MEGAAGLGSQADHRASVERQLGRKIKVPQGETVVDLEEPEFPELVAYVWRWFQELAARRTGGAVGPNPLTHTEVEAWARLTQRDPSIREVRLLLRLDDVMMTHFREATAK